MKLVTVSAFFPDLASAHAFQEARGQGSTVAIATGRAVEALFRLPPVKGRRIHGFKLTVGVLDQDKRKNKRTGKREQHDEQHGAQQSTGAEVEQSGLE